MRDTGDNFRACSLFPRAQTSSILNVTKLVSCPYGSYIMPWV